MAGQQPGRGSISKPQGRVEYSFLLKYFVNEKLIENKELFFTMGQCEYPKHFCHVSYNKN